MTTRRRTAITGLWLSVIWIATGCGGGKNNNNNNKPPDSASPLSKDMAMTPVEDMASMPSNDDLGTPCGAAVVGGPQGLAPSAACLACAFANCCNELMTCSANPDCVAYRQCLTACNPDDSSCTNPCGQNSPGGTLDSGVFSACRNYSCNLECQNFTCTGKVKWDTPAGTVDINFTLSEYLAGTPLMGLVVKGCPLADVQCLMPYKMGTSDAMGQVSLPALPRAASGVGAHFDISGMGVMPTLYYFNAAEPTLRLADPRRLRPAMLSPQSWMQLTGAAGITVDNTRGSVIFNAYDCFDYGAQGVSVTSTGADAATKTAYFKGTSPMTMATATFATASGTIVNLPPGTQTLTWTNDAGTNVGSMQVLVRAGSLTAVSLVPTP